MAITADGKITSARRDYPRFTSPVDSRMMDRLRAEADAILVGAGTLRADDPALHVRELAMQEYRRSLGKTRGLIKVLVTASLDLAGLDRALADPDGGGIIVATTEEAPTAREAELASRAEVWRVGRGRVDLRLLLRRLKERGVERLLVEGGGETNWALVEHDLIDEIHVTLAPALLGGRNAPTWLEGEGWTMDQVRRLTLVDLRREGDEVYLHWAVVRDEPS